MKQPSMGIGNFFGSMPAPMQNIETQEWLYYEQDGMVVTLGNWLKGRLSCEQIEQLWCELIIPEQNKEQKESEE